MAAKQETKAAVTAMSGWKMLIWLALGQLIAALSQNIELLELGPKLQWLVPFIGMALATIGKMIASFVATPEN